MAPPALILTPDQRVRVFVSSTMAELAAERAAVRRAIERLRLSPVLFELGARAHPPRSLYLSYLEQSHVFLGIYWQRYGWVAPDMDVSGLEDEWLLSGDRPKLLYVKEPAPEREPRLRAMLDRVITDGAVSFKPFATTDELEQLVIDDLALLLTESFLVGSSIVLPGPSSDPVGAGATAAVPVQASLPAIASSFVGRTDDVDTLSALLDRSDAPIITLTGPGGVGKTRLAVECATANCARYDEGTAFVGLASLRDPAQVIPALAEAVGVRDVGTGAVGDVLRRDLAERSLLLVIDNFEHLMGAADELGALLAAASGVQALVTSREALRVAGEHEFAVEPMNDDDALELFARRASAVRRDFTLDAANEARARAICQQVDRVPLAIELAAARTRLLPLDALLDRLGRRLDFLTGGPRDLPARHQALRDTVEWSYELLDDAERWVFAQLGVFVGSFSLAAARAVLGGDELLVLDQLASLVEKSLLRVEATTGEPRFRMLGMIRDLAVERLDVAEAADPTRERHAAFFRAFSLELGAGVRGPDQAAWLDILGRADEGDAGNVKTALSWYLEHGRLDQCVEMAWALWPAVWVNGRLEQGDALAAIAGADGELAPLARARLLVLAGLFPLWRGEHDTAWAALEEALVLGAALPDDEVVAYATLASAMLAGPAKGEDHAEAYALDGVARCRALGDRWAEAAALNALSWLYVAKDHFEDRAVFDETIAASKACGDQHFAAMAEVNLAEYELARGDVTAAERLLESSAERHRALRIMYSLAYLLDAAARVAVARGDDVLAARLVGAADHRREVVGIGVWGSQLVRRDAMIEGMVVRLGDEAFARAHAVGAALGYGECLDLVPGPD